METEITGSKPSSKKVAQFAIKKGLLLIIISSLAILEGCLSDEFSADTPKPAAVPFQLHNFNAPLNGATLEGTAPDIYYFKQKDDGTYVFMLTSTNYPGFETNWATDYVLVQADVTGVIQKTTVMKLPAKDGGVTSPKLANVFDYPPPAEFNQWVGLNYVADKYGFLYYQVDDWSGNPLINWTGNLFFNLDPETGLYDHFLGGSTHGQPMKIARTSDGGVISTGSIGQPDFEKHSASGTLQFRQPVKYWETRPSLNYLTDENGDYYFVGLYNGININGNTGWQNTFTENTAKSFFYFHRYFISFGLPVIDWEIRFGPGKKQKAYRLNRVYKYLDYVDVPFEVWDLTNNRQLMAAFRDQGEEGEFTLLAKKYNSRAIFQGQRVPSINPNYLGNADPTWSTEFIVAFPTIPYSTTPDQVVVSDGSLPNFFVWAYLTEGATWNPDDLPASSFAMKKETKPGPQLLKVNANGSTVVKDNYVLGTVPLKNIYKSVPYNEGFAVLINAPSTSDYQPSQLVLLDANFEQKDVISLTSTPSDFGHQLEGGNDRVFYARITSNTESTIANSNKSSLLLYTIRNGFSTERNLDDLIPFKLEKYRMTPTKRGGVAIVAWVRPTKDTRDLLFFELDENLELVKR